MDYLVYILIICGAMLMVSNIIRYYIFTRSSMDVLSSGNRINVILEKSALVLLIFFLIGYLLVAFLGKPDLMMANILFFGSVFVAIMLILLFRLTGTLKENSLNIAKTLIGVVDTRDPNLKGHSRYVQNVTMLLYDRLPAEKKAGINAISLEFAALMHDIGKLGIPEEILNKPSALNDEEWKIMKNHPMIGVDILRPLESFREILPWIEYHHERLDGKGYYGLSADMIPSPAKILAVADTYSAITMRRSYKSPRTYEEAIRIMKEVAGHQLDKELVDILASIPKEDLIKCVPESVEV